MKPRVLFLGGPTGAGKSEIALDLAQKLSGELISVDSMQVYRGMDIGTAKASREEQHLVPHHLIDILDPSQLFSVYEFRERALAAIQDILQRGKTPIAAGGTGLYMRALLEGLSEQPPGSETIRRRLEASLAERGAAVLHEELGKIDAEAASAIKPSDAKRIIRALEIYELSGKGPSQWRGRRQTLADLGYKPVVIGLTRPRAELYAALDQRVDRMFERGLVREVGQLSKRPLSRTARQAVGYKELLERMDEGGQWTEEALAEARRLIKLNTRHLAKRQMTWFRRERDVTWIEINSRMNPHEASREVQRLFEASVPVD